MKKTFTKSILNEVSVYYRNKKNYLNESEDDGYTDQLLQTAMEAYSNAGQDDISIVETTDDYILIDINSEQGTLSLDVEFEYDVREFSQTDDTYENPGYLNFESSIQATSLRISQEETGEEQEYFDGEGLQLAERIAQDFKNIIDEQFIDSNDTIDFNNSLYEDSKRNPVFKQTNGTENNFNLQESIERTVKEIVTKTLRRK